MTKTNEENPVVDQKDPSLFFIGFRLSPTYSAAFDLFFAGKQTGNDVEYHEKVEAFERSTAARDALVKYAEYEVHFAYCPEFLTEVARTRMDDYIALVRHVQSRHGSSRDEIEDMDSVRRLRHLRVAQQLVADGVAPNVLLGRVLARLALISQGLESYEDARAMR